MEPTPVKLSVADHRRDSAGLTYIYPVISRRAGGVSVGINLNINNACNWACAYCQVPNLTRGGPPPIDLDLLERELEGFLVDATHGDFMARAVPPEARRLMDVAFSGNGEPTSAAEFPDAVARVGAVLERLGLKGRLMVRLITNGSLLHRPGVQAGIAALGQLGGEVWFKLDRGTREDVERVNGVALAPEKAVTDLRRCCALAPTWVQSCFFARDGKAPEEAEVSAYLEQLKAVRGEIRGVHLYGLARPTLQPGGEHLSRLPEETLRALGKRIADLGLRVEINP